MTDGFTSEELTDPRDAEIARLRERVAVLEPLESAPLCGDHAQTWYTARPSIETECVQCDHEAEIERLRKALEGMVALHKRNMCPHSVIERGGVIWTFCRHCGEKWADDEGGFKPDVVPPEVKYAREALAKRRPR